MNLHALRIFAKVAETKSVTQTADVLSLTQPAVTAQLEHCKVRSVSVFLNEMAEALHLRKWGKLYPYARQVFEAEKEVEYQITLLQNGKKGRLASLLPMYHLTFYCQIGLLPLKHLHHRQKLN
ncbi:hypothetical protein BSAF29S_03687 [Bacillus safensis subsp. safensis]